MLLTILHWILQVYIFPLITRGWTKSKYVTVKVWIQNILVTPTLVPIPILFMYLKCYMFQMLKRIYFLFKNCSLTMFIFLNFILIILLLKAKEKDSTVSSPTDGELYQLCGSTQTLVVETFVAKFTFIPKWHAHLYHLNTK